MKQLRLYIALALCCVLFACAHDAPIDARPGIDATVAHVDAGEHHLVGSGIPIPTPGAAGLPLVSAGAGLTPTWSTLAGSALTLPIQVPNNTVIIQDSSNGQNLLGVDSTGNVQMNAATGKAAALANNGTNQVWTDGTNFNVGGSQNIFMTDTSGGSHSIGYGNTATASPSTLTLVAQTAGGGGPTAGGSVGLVSGSGVGGGAVGQVAFFFGGVAATDQIVFQGAATSSGIGTVQWSKNITPALTQSNQSSTSGSATAGTAFSATAQSGQVTTGAGLTGGAGGALNLNGGNGGNGTGSSGSGGNGGAVNVNGGAPGALNTPGTAGPVNLQTGGTTQVAVQSILTTFTPNGGAERLRTETSGVSINGAGSYGSGTGVLFINNASANPSASPAGGALFYSSGGQAFVRSATDTTGLKVGTTQEANATSSQSVTSSTTLTNVTNVSFVMGATDTYAGRWSFESTFVSSSGIVVSMTVPTGATLDLACFGVNAVAVPFCNITAGGASCTLASGATTLMDVGCDFVVVADGTHSGTVQPQFTQQTSSGTATTIAAGDRLYAVKK